MAVGEGPGDGPGDVGGGLGGGLDNTFQPSLASNPEPLYDQNGAYERWLTNHENQLAAAQSTAAQFDQFQAANMADWADIHPGASPGVVTSMGAAGVDPLSEAGTSFALSDMERTSPSQPQFRAGGMVNGANQSLLSPEIVELQSLMDEANSVGLINDNGNLTSPSDDAPQALHDTFNDVAEAHERFGEPFIFEDGDRLLVQDWGSDSLLDITDVDPAEVDPADPSTFANIRDASPEADEGRELRTSSLEQLFNNLSGATRPRDMWSTYAESDATVADFLSTMRGEYDPDDENWVGYAFNDLTGSQVFDDRTRDQMATLFTQINGLDEEQAQRFHQTMATEPAEPTQGFLDSQIRDVVNDQTAVPDTDPGLMLGDTISNAVTAGHESVGAGDIFSAAVNDASQLVSRAGGESVGAAAHAVGEPVVGAVPEGARDIVSRLAKGTVRTTMLGAEAIYQQLQTTAMDVANAPRQIQEHGLFGTPDEPAAPTDAEIAVRGLLSGEDVDVGGGWLPDPESQVRAERDRRVRERFGERGGHTPTLGRMAAQAAGLDPDSHAWDSLSGLVDFSASFADPTIYMNAGATRTGRIFRPDMAESGALGLTEARRARRPDLPGTFDGPRAQLPEQLRNPTVPSSTQTGTVGLNPAAYADEIVPARPTLNLPDNASLYDRVRHAGGKAGNAPGTDEVRVSAYLGSREGRRTVDAIAGESNSAQLWRDMGRRDPNLARRLADTPDPTEVANILHPHLGTTYRGTGEVRRRTMFDRARRRAPHPIARRWLDRIPDDRVNLRDPNTNMAQLERWASNVELDQVTTDSWMDRMARTATAPGRRNVWVDFMDDEVLPQLTSRGVDKGLARDLTRLYRDDLGSFRQYMTDERANPLRIESKIVEDGVVTELPRPVVSSELAEGTLPLPDFRAARRQLHGYSRLLASSDGELRKAAQTVLKTQSAWKQSAVIRPAYALRVMPEEMARMYAAGYDAPFNHPASYLMWMTTRRKDRALGNSALAETSEMRSAMVADSRTYFSTENRNLVALGRDDVTHIKGRDPEFNAAWLRKMNLLHSSDEVRYLLDHGVDDTVEWMMRGNGRYVRNRFREAGFREFDGDTALTEFQVRNYLQNDVQRAIDINTGGDPDLLDAVRNGSVDNTPFTRDKDGFHINSDAADVLDTYQHAAPMKVAGPKIKRQQLSDRHRNNFVDTAFEWMVAQPQDKLSRSPVFYQAYWHRMREMSHFASDDALARADNLAKSQTDLHVGLPDWLKERVPDNFNPNFRITRNFRRDLVRRQGRKPVNNLSFDEMDVVAKQHAMDEVKRLLFDSTRRGQAMDGMRLLFPFGDAWTEVMSTWMKLLRAGEGFRPAGFLPNPKTLRMGHAADEIANGEHTSGAFREGEHGTVFEYPMSSVMSSAVTGSPTPFVGHPDGLSMMTSATPGLGPVAQIPAAYALRSRPEDDEIREMLLPFGVPFDVEDPTTLSNALNFAPPWMQNAFRTGAAGLAGGEGMYSDRQYGNAYMELMRYEMSTGRWDLSDPTEFERLQEQVESRLPGWFALRTLGSLGAPAAPQPEWVMEDSRVDEGTVATWATRDLLFQLQDEYGFEEGNELFIEEFGDRLYALTTMSKTESRLPGQLPISTEFNQWLGENEDLRANYPDVYHLLFPGDPDGRETSFSLYRNQVARGERVQTSPEDWIRDVNEAEASRRYHEYRRQVGPNPDPRQAEWLRNIRAELRAAFPGYQGGQLTDPAELGPLMDQVTRAAANPQVASTDLGWALNQYLNARAQAQAMADQDPDVTTFTSAQAYKPVRDWLRDTGIMLAAEVPEFQAVFDAVLERELPPEDLDPGAPEWATITEQREEQFTGVPSGTGGMSGGVGMNGAGGMSGGVQIGGAMTIGTGG